MSTNKNHFLKKNKSIALEESKKRDAPFYERLDGKSFVPDETPKHSVEKVEKKRIRKPKMR